MGAYSQAGALKTTLQSLIREEIENNATIKACIKAKKAIVWELPDKSTKTIKVKFLSDVLSGEKSSPISFPYNPRIESFLSTAKVKETAVSVWYSQSIGNGIVMQSGNWTE